MVVTTMVARAPVAPVVGAIRPTPLCTVFIAAIGPLTVSGADVAAQPGLKPGKARK
jgi:hypothetical protein